MSKTKKNRNTSKAQAQTITTNTKALSNPKALHERPTTNPNKFLALFFGIPTAILIAAITVRLLGNG